MRRAPSDACSAPCMCAAIRSWASVAMASDGDDSSQTSNRSTAPASPGSATIAARASSTALARFPCPAASEAALCNLRARSGACDVPAAKRVHSSICFSTRDAAPRRRSRSWTSVTSSGESSTARSSAANPAAGVAERLFERRNRPLVVRPGERIVEMREADAAYAKGVSGPAGALVKGDELVERAAVHLRGDGHPCRGRLEQRDGAVCVAEAPARDAARVDLQGGGARGIASSDASSARRPTSQAASRCATACRTQLARTGPMPRSRSRPRRSAALAASGCSSRRSRSSAPLDLQPGRQARLPLVRIAHSREVVGQRRGGAVVGGQRRFETLERGRVIGAHFERALPGDPRGPRVPFEVDEARSLGEQVGALGVRDRLCELGVEVRQHRSPRAFALSARLQAAKHRVRLPGRRGGDRGLGVLDGVGGVAEELVDEGPLEPRARDGDGVRPLGREPLADRGVEALAPVPEGGLGPVEGRLVVAERARLGGGDRRVHPRHLLALVVPDADALGVRRRVVDEVLPRGARRPVEELRGDRLASSPSSTGLPDDCTNVSRASRNPAAVWKRAAGSFASARPSASASSAG